MSTPLPNVRVRFAPSPTGYLHVGGARTALFNYLFARRHNGKFILRVEDTDEARSTDESLRMVMDDLLWLGLKWDEGPHPETLADMGDLGPYRQSARLAIYKKYADQLLQSGHAYYCFLTDEEIDAQRHAKEASQQTYHIESPFADWSLDQAQAHIAKGNSGVVRFRTKNLKKDYVFTDLVRGEVRFPSDMVGDFVLLRTGGMPVYNFCNVIDDHLMQISHVLRAEEHLSNTLRQLMIYEALGWKPPEFGHLSLILDEERKKLSKRKGATSCHEFKQEGYLPEAMNNFLALLGWSHPEGHEVMTMQTMTSAFTIDRVNPAGAVFDAVKLKWMNSQYLRELPEPKLWSLLEPFLKNANLHFNATPEWQVATMQAFKSAMETLVDAVELYRPLATEHYQLSPEAEEVLTWPSTKILLTGWVANLKKRGDVFLTGQDFAEIQNALKTELNIKGKFLFMPLRAAIIGKAHGTDVASLVPFLHPQELIRRAELVISRAI